MKDWLVISQSHWNEKQTLERRHRRNTANKAIRTIKIINRQLKRTTRAFQDLSASPWGRRGARREAPPCLCSELTACKQPHCLLVRVGAGGDRLLVTPGAAACHTQWPPSWQSVARRLWPNSPLSHQRTRWCQERGRKKFPQLNRTSVGRKGGRNVICDMPAHIRTHSLGTKPISYGWKRISRSTNWWEKRLKGDTFARKRL